ncbi:hypothetical protein TNCV_2529291 [Trichonephila clavipes]|nr:hypothetical protein TNCV_2529291 [Trichonephila clavipes]
MHSSGRKCFRSVLGVVVNNSIGGNRPALPQSFELPLPEEQYGTFYKHRGDRYAPDLRLGRRKYTSRYPTQPSFLGTPCVLTIIIYLSNARASLADHLTSSLAISTDDVVSRISIESSALEQMVTIHLDMAAEWAGPASSQSKSVEIYSREVMSDAEKSAFLYREDDTFPIHACTLKYCEVFLFHITPSTDGHEKPSGWISHVRAVTRSVIRGVRCEPPYINKVERQSAGNTIENGCVASSLTNNIF